MATCHYCGKNISAQAKVTKLAAESAKAQAHTSCHERANTKFAAAMKKTGGKR